MASFRVHFWTINKFNPSILHSYSYIQTSHTTYIHILFIHTEFRRTTLLTGPGLIITELLTSERRRFWKELLTHLRYDGVFCLGRCSKQPVTCRSIFLCCCSYHSSQSRTYFCQGQSYLGWLYDAYKTPFYVENQQTWKDVLELSNFSNSDLIFCVTRLPSCHLLHYRHYTV
jgi:hypothetical protein